MPRIQYVTKRFTPTSQLIIDQADGILEEYADQGFQLTLRQLYYQFVVRGIIPNNQLSYKRLGSIINDARLAGMLDWSQIVDRTRGLENLSHWANPTEIIEVCAKQFRIDLWAKQTHRVEVWIEKDALVGVIEPVCERNDVPYLSCRGYTSQSAMWTAAQRLLKWEDRNQVPVILHLGDHDPSGLDMSRDIQDRMALFGVHTVQFHRLALNLDQIQKYNPPPNFAKQTDARYRQYVRDVGQRECWELDALEPSVLDELIQRNIEMFRDNDMWEIATVEQERHRVEIGVVSKHWDKAVKAARKG